MPSTVAVRRTQITTRDPRLLFEDGFGGNVVNDVLWTKIDSEAKFSVSGGRLNCAGGRASPDWGDPQLLTALHIRRAGLTLEQELTPTNANDYKKFGWNTGTTFATATLLGWYLQNDGFIYAYSEDGESLIPKIVAYSAATSYRFRVVLKASGALWYYSTDKGLTWKLLWESAVGTSNLRAGYGTYDGLFTSDYCRISLSVPKPTMLSDTFTRDDSALTLGNTETNQAWTAVSGTWGISSNKAYSASNANGDLATVDAGIADGIFDCTVRGDLNGAAYAVPDVVLRGVDANNFLFVRLYGGTAELLKVDGGVASSLSQVAQTTTDDTDYVVRVVMIGNQVSIYVDGVFLILVTLAGGDTKYAGYTQYGMRLVTEGSPTANARWDNFKVQGGLP